jgi:hypothetical protein
VSAPLSPLDRLTAALADDEHLARAIRRAALAAHVSVHARAEVRRLTRVAWDRHAASADRN